MKTNVKTISWIHLSVFLGLSIALGANGQEKTTNYDLVSLQQNNKLEVSNRQVSTFSESDISGIRFSKNEGDGIAWIKGLEFSNGTIELDIRGKDVIQQSFVGVAFHGIDHKTHDVVYFRPFNFQSDDPVRKIHSVQYVSHPENTWNVLREKHNGKFEKAVNPAPGASDWFHVKIVVHYPHVMAYVNGNEEPSLSIEKLNDRKTGSLGLWVGNNSDGDFANLQIIHEH
ncbi:MAG TPA: family 16 glycoside hydrolase [Cyclobacteriaceae bacterium]|nr:family 16 glycoside hydrolase [Cyclobacteriaceae bacterium]